MLLSLAGLLAVASAGPAAVFCVADNGHAAVEVLASTCCTDEVGSFGRTAILESSDSDHRDAACGPCVDLQLTSPSRLEASAKAALPMCVAPNTLAAVPALNITIRIGTFSARNITPPPTLELLASVVLLT